MIYHVQTLRPIDIKPSSEYLRLQIPLPTENCPQADLEFPVQRYGLPAIKLERNKYYKGKKVGGEDFRYTRKEKEFTMEGADLCPNHLGERRFWSPSPQQERCGLEQECGAEESSNTVCAELSIYFICAATTLTNSLEA